MNPFETTLMKLAEEAREIQKGEIENQMRAKVFSEKLMGFLKENGLPENFTIPELALLAVRKSRA